MTTTLSKLLRGRMLRLRAKVAESWKSGGRDKRDPPANNPLRLGDPVPSPLRFRRAGAFASLVFGALLAAGRAGEDPAALAAAAQVTALPPLDDFSAIWGKDTFRPADASAASAGRSVEEWSLAALMRIRGQPYAILVHEASGERIYVGPSPNRGGYSIAAAHFDKDPSLETVTLRQNQQSTVIRYAPSVMDELKKRFQQVEKTRMIPPPVTK